MAALALRASRRMGGSEAVKAGRVLLWTAALTSLVVCYWVAFVAPAVGGYHDDGVYLVTAKALAQGDGYRIISLPESLPQTKYPIFFPFVLSLVWRLLPRFPDNALFLKLVPLLATVVWCGFVYLIVKNQTGKRPALAIGWLTLASPWVLFLSTTMLSETTFAALCWGSLWLLGVVQTRQNMTAAATWRSSGDSASPSGAQTYGLVLLAGCLAGAAMLTRTVGVAVIIAGMFWLLARRRVGLSAVFTISAATLIAPWLMWVGAAAKQIPAEAGYYSSSNYSSWAVPWNFEWVDKITVVLGNGIQIFFAPANILGAPTPLIVPLGLFLGVLMLVGFFARVLTGPSVLDLFFLLYLGVILLWPWPPTRFLVPLYPLILLYMWNGLEVVTARLAISPRRKSALIAVTVSTLVGFAVAGMARVSLHDTRSGISWPVTNCSDSWSDYEALIRWVRAETAEDAVLVGILDPLLYLYTDRKSQRAFSLRPVELYYKSAADREPLGPPSELIRRIEAAGADYVVDTPESCFGEAPFLRRQIDVLRQRAPDALVPVPIGARWAQRIFRIRRSRLPALAADNDA